MTVHLADVRDADPIEKGTALLATLRRLTCDKEILLARAEKRIASITAETMEKTDPIDAAIRDAENELTGLILANRSRFVSPRQVKTPDGTFGFRKSTRVEIVNEEALLDAIMDRGYDECLKVTRTFNKAKLREHMEAGEVFPGCEMTPGEVAGYTISKALIDQATALVKEGADHA